MSAHDRWELRLGEPGYPEQLALSPRPPLILYGIGDRTTLASGLGVVGARKATPYGLTVSERFAAYAASRGVRVLSGAAIGCDQAAQRAALRAGGTTVAVLGCGADVDYPSGSRDLLRSLRDGRGAVISELPWETPPMRWAFRERNRIIAGLSAALLVVEAALPSGTFSTADYALDAGRDVLAVPGSILAPECRGTNRLIRQGATPITDVSELAASLHDCGLLSSVEPSPSRPPAGHPDTIAAALIADPMRPDDIARALDVDIVTVMRRIARLEAGGVVTRYADGRYGPARGAGGIQ